MGKTLLAAPPQADRYLVPGLMRGLELLQLFTAAAPRHTQAELAAALGVTRSAVFRIVYTLTQQGFLLHDPATRCYSLGPAVLRLGYGFLAARDLLEVALPVLERLRDATGWSAHLAVREGREVLYLLRVPTRRGQASIVHVGSRLPAEATAMGRVLLADLPEAEVMALYRGAAPRRAGAGGPASLAALLKRARADRASIVVAQFGSFEAGVASFAAPLRDVSGRVVAAINVTAALADASGEARRGAVAEALRRAAGEISASLGHAAAPAPPPARRKHY
jgi:DNA-binding IclR family transcriptional regulator